MNSQWNFGRGLHKIAKQAAKKIAANVNQGSKDWKAGKVKKYGSINPFKGL